MFIDQETKVLAKISASETLSWETRRSKAGGVPGGRGGIRRGRGPGPQRPTMNGEVLKEGVGQLDRLDVLLSFCQAS